VRYRVLTIEKELNCLNLSYAVFASSLALI